MDFWEAIAAQLQQARTARSADDVIRIFQPPSSADAFFAGSGGDDSLESALDDAGWTHTWRVAHYYWSMQTPDGSEITYIEGDIYRGNRPPIG